MERSSFGGQGVNDVFSRTKPTTDDAGRVVAVSDRWQLIRLRSLPIWCGCHWAGMHLLCGGKQCELCRTGVPKRSYGFSIVDRPQDTAALIRFSASDVARLEASVRCTDPARDLKVGDQFKIRREKDRVPLTVEFVTNSSQILELQPDFVMLEILRLHQIQASPRDVAERSFYGMICARAAQACSGQRSLIQ